MCKFVLILFVLTCTLGAYDHNKHSVIVTQCSDCVSLATVCNLGAYGRCVKDRGLTCWSEPPQNPNYLACDKELRKCETAKQNPHYGECLQEYEKCAESTCFAENVERTVILVGENLNVQSRDDRAFNTLEELVDLIDIRPPESVYVIWGYFRFCDRGLIKNYYPAIRRRGIDLTIRSGLNAEDFRVIFADEQPVIVYIEKASILSEDVVVLLTVKDTYEPSYDLIVYSKKSGSILEKKQMYMAVEIF